MRCHVRIAKFTMINLAKILAETNDFFLLILKVYIYIVFCLLFLTNISLHNLFRDMKFQSWQFHNAKFLS